ncbi:hypothetical protein RFI_24691, partial [Reticulomyxa filosa]
IDVEEWEINELNQRKLGSLYLYIYIYIYICICSFFFIFNFFLYIIHQKKKKRNQIRQEMTNFRQPIRVQQQQAAKVIAIREDQKDNLHLELASPKKVYKVEETEEEEKDSDLSAIPQHPVMIIGPLGVPMKIEPYKLPKEHQKQFLRIWKNQQKYLLGVDSSDSAALAAPANNSNKDAKQDQNAAPKTMTDII